MQFEEAPLTIGAVFDDLITGVEALRQVSEAHGAKLIVRLQEIESEDHDPSLHQRPSRPAVPRFDVELQAAGPDPHAVVVAMFDAVGLDEEEGTRRLGELPCTLARSLVASRAHAIAELLTRAGATVGLLRNDG